MSERKCYISRGRFLYTTKRIHVRGSAPVWRISICLARSGSWLQLPGLPDFPTLESAEKRLDGLAKDNGWGLISYRKGLKKTRCAT